jgi:hypothetical protein
MSVYDWYKKGWQAVGKLVGGTHVFERDWDVLVLLDCARPEMFDEVSDEYDFISGDRTHQSVASCSFEWLWKTFSPEYAEELGQTVYVTGNPNTIDVDGTRYLQELIDVWNWGWDDERHTVPPRQITEEAIRTARDQDFDRLIVHYMQPHAPFLSAPDVVAGGMNRPGENNAGHNIQSALRSDDLSKSRARELHLDNLRCAIDDVEILRKNIDAEKMVLSSDHGQAFGEWGFYGHPCGIPISALRKVPWELTSATDTHSYEPSSRPAQPSEMGDVEDKLRALGYRE